MTYTDLLIAIADRRQRQLERAAALRRTVEARRASREGCGEPVQPLVANR